MMDESEERVLKTLTPKERAYYVTLSPSEKVEFGRRKVEEFHNLLQIAESVRHSDDAAIASGLMVTEAEIDRRISTGELTLETCEEFLRHKIVRWNDGTYGVWKEDE